MSGDPFRKTFNKNCEHCDGRGFNVVTEQIPPSDLKVCECCEGCGLVCYGWSEEDFQEEICPRCDGFRYLKDRMVETNLDIEKKCKDKGIYISWSKNAIGIKLTTEEATNYGIQKVTKSNERLL